MRFPTAIVATTAMLALTFAIQPASASFSNPGFYTAEDNHLLADPTEPAAALQSLPSQFAGCSAQERQIYATHYVDTGVQDPLGLYHLASGLLPMFIQPASSDARKNVTVEIDNREWTQVVKSEGGCLSMPANVTGKLYHAQVSMLGVACPGLISFPGGGADDCVGGILGLSQVCFYDAGYNPIRCDGGFSQDDNNGGQDDSVTQLVGYQSVPGNAAFADIEASGPIGVNVVGFFWQDS